MVPMVNDRQVAKLYVSIFGNSRFCEIYDVISTQIHTILSCIIIAVMYVNNNCLRRLVKKGEISATGKNIRTSHNFLQV